MNRAAALHDIAGYLADWLQFQADYRRIPGLQVAVRYQGDLVVDLAYGVADESTGEAMTADHLFRIASHSKTFTGTAVLQLLEQEKLRLDDPIGQWVPQLGQDDAPICAVTLRALLGHLSGVTRDGSDSDFWQRLRPFPDVADLLRTAGEDPVFGPDEHFKYSNIGYGLLGLAIEAASGQTYAQYLREHVLGPLGLEHTGADHDPEREREYAAGHTGLLTGTDRRETITHVHTAALAPATGVYSTARDLTRYLAAHALGTGELLTDGSKRLMQRLESVITVHGKEAGRYGVGMSLGVVGDRQLVGHGGNYPGHISRSYLDATDSLAVSVLANAIDAPAEPLAKGLIALIDLALAPPADPQSSAEGAAALRTYTGRFANLWGVADVVDLGGRLVIVRPAAPDPLEGYTEAAPIDADHLQLERVPGFGPVGERVTYHRDDDGRIGSVRIGGATFWPIEDFRRRRSGLAQDTHHA